MSCETNTIDTLEEIIKSIKAIKKINEFDTVELGQFKKKIAKAITSGQVAFLTGAGISIGRSTCAPGWLGMMKEILSEIALITETKKFQHRYDNEHFASRLSLFFNEQVLQIIGTMLGNDAAEQVVTDALPTTHSCVHRFLALCAVVYRCPVLTTNFDDLERSAFKEGEGKGVFSVGEQTFEDNICFLHGTKNDPGSLRIRVNQVFCPQPKDQEAKIEAMLRNRILIVLGYNGQDDFDVMPYLFRNSEYPLAIVWVVHNPPGEKPPLNMPAHRNSPKLKFYMENTDSLLQDIYRKMPKGNTEKSLLPEEWKDECSDKDKNYWESKIKCWGKKWRKDEPQKMLKLWGTILEKMRLYSVQIDGKTRNIAIEAQEMIRDFCDDSIDKIEAELKIIEMNRVGNSDATKMKEMFEQLEKKLNNNIDAPQFKRLKRIFAHQYGTWLQNQDDYENSERYLNEAIRVARENDYPERSYSLFQKFMMAWRASTAKPPKPTYFEKYTTDDKNGLYQLFKDIKTAANQFLAEHKFEHYATTLHNVAFVKQVLGELFFQDSKRNCSLDERILYLNETINNYRVALEVCMKAKDYRLRLRDPRRIAQSNVRIIECSLGQIESYIHLIDINASGQKDVHTSELKKLYESVFGGCKETEQDIEDDSICFWRLIKEISNIYDELAQENMRFDDVKKIFQKAKNIHKFCNNLHMNAVISQIDCNLHKFEKEFHAIVDKHLEKRSS